MLDSIYRMSLELLKIALLERKRQYVVMGVIPQRY